MPENLKIALIIPCYNEEITIGKVIDDAKKYAPQAAIYVIDNNSSDQTSAIALEKGVNVIYEYKQGKAYAVRTAFRVINADVYVMIDGDDTYPLDQIDKIIAPILSSQADMTVGDRHFLGHYSAENTRKFHGFGNNLVKKTINLLFNAKLNDILSGYRGFSRSFVKNYPLICEGFEIEADMTIHALHYDYKVLEVPITFQERPDGSESKLNTYTDGMKIMSLIFELYRDNRPLAFFSIFSSIIFIISLLSGGVVIDEFLKTQYITHVPLAILSSSSFILAILLFISGLILDTMVKQDKKNHALRLLSE
ncbi:MAG: glycosyltransferase [Burkholderiales bacterium]|nr:glycosyltransferase [Burkholderiales bacterium]MBP9769462.1 glycosyltransferase [Burkholderiales bacterium]